MRLPTALVLALAVNGLVWGLIIALIFLVILSALTAFGEAFDRYADARVILLGEASAYPHGSGNPQAVKDGEKTVLTEMLGAELEGLRSGELRKAMKRGDIDAMVLWEPFESQAVAEGDAYFSQKLEYSQSRAVGAELGMLAASGEAMTQKKELVRRFLWAYLKAEETLSKNKDVFADAYSKYTGLPLNVTKESAKIIKLGGVLTKDQVSRLAEAAFKQGIVQKDVTKEAAALYDDSMVVELKK